MIGRVSNGLAVLVPGGASAGVATLKAGCIAKSLDIVVVARLCVVAGLVRAGADAIALRGSGAREGEGGNSR